MSEDGAPAFDTLTRRERDCLRMLCEGSMSAEVATALGIGRSTLDKHLTSARTKLGVRRTAHAMVLCERHRLFDEGADSGAIETFAERSAALSDLGTELYACRTFAAAWRVLRRRAAEIGADHLNFGVIAEPNGMLTNGARMIAMSLPEELRRMYENIGGADADPFFSIVASGRETVKLDAENTPRELLAMMPPRYRQFNDAHRDHQIRFVFGSNMRDIRTGATYAVPYSVRRDAAREMERHERRYFEMQRNQIELFWNVAQSRRFLREFVSLTARQRRALQHAARGFTNAEGAEHMGVSVRAFEKLLAKARETFHAPTTTAAVYRATVYRALD